MSLNIAGQHYLIVHGYRGAPSAHWFPWLAEALRQDRATVSVPAMPDPLAPDPDAWAQTLEQTLPVMDSRTTLIGHSLGCITVLRHLQRVGTTIGAYVLVSGFDRALPGLPELEAFTAAPIDHGRLRAQAPQRASIMSDNDTIVDPAASRDLATHLQTEIREIRGGGHFLDREGFTQLSPLLDLLRKFREQTST